MQRVARLVAVMNLALSDLPRDSSMSALVTPPIQLNASKLFKGFSPSAAALMTIEESSLHAWPQRSRSASIPVETIENPKSLVISAVHVGRTEIVATDVDDSIAPCETCQRPPHRGVLCRG